MTAATIVLPTMHGSPAMPRHRVITERIKLSLRTQIIQQADAVCAARNEDRSDVVLRIMRAYSAGRWAPSLGMAIPTTGARQPVDIRLRPEDIGPYLKRCTAEQYPQSLPVAHGLWIYATTPDPTKLPF